MKFIASLALVTFTMLLSVLIMIYGWGLTAASWPWIIGGIFMQLFIIIMSEIIKES